MVNLNFSYKIGSFQYSKPMKLKSIDVYLVNINVANVLYVQAL